MGGPVNVAIRLKDGRSFCQEHWTNSIPAWLKNVRAFNGDTQHFLDYIDEYNGSRKGELYGAPSPVRRTSSYGLIVFDCLTNTILDDNGYTSLLEYSYLHTGGPNRDEAFVELAKADKISIRQVFFKDKVVDGIREKVIKFSPKETLLQGELEYCNSLDRQFRADYFAQFVIDPSPMQYFHFKEGDWKSYKAKLLEIGFPMNKKTGLNESLRYVDGKVQRL